MQRQQVGWWVQGLGEGRRELAFTGDRVSVWGEGNILELDGGDGGMIL